MLPQFTFATISHHHARQADPLFSSRKLFSQLSKLNDWDKKTFICHLELFAYDNLKTLGHLLKFGHILSQSTVQKYLRDKELLGLRVEKNSLYHQNTRRISGGGGKNIYIKQLRIEFDLYIRIRLFLRRVYIQEAVTLSKESVLQ